jgi:hypothetical protein
MILANDLHDECMKGNSMNANGNLSVIEKATRCLSDRFGLATMARKLLCDSLFVKGVEIVLTRP